ncbi:hypothetical protein ACSSS7_004754 [Eimeria intestinalis]
MSQQQKLRVLLRFLAVCCGSEEGSQVPSNFVLQQLLQHRRDVAKVRARRFAMQCLDAAAAADIPAASQQLHSDFKPFTKKFGGDIQTAIEAFNQMVLIWINKEQQQQQQQQQLDQSSAAAAESSNSSSKKKQTIARMNILGFCFAPANLIVCLGAAAAAVAAAALSSTAGCLQAAAFIIDQREGKVLRDFQLPFTGLPFSKGVQQQQRDQQQQQQQQQQQLQEQQDSEDTLFSAYKRTTSPTSLQSPFAALSCLSDKVVACSMDRLSDSLRVSLPFQPEVMCAGAPLKPQLLPALDGISTSSVLVEVLQHNSYLEDLFVHGSLMRVVKENGIAPEHLWSLLQRFVASLKRLEEGLRMLFLIKDAEATSPTPGQMELVDLVASAHKRLKEVLQEQAA